MTNEQKADEIVEAVRRSVVGRYSDADYRENYFMEVRDCVLLMAEWKDSQRVSADTFRDCVCMLNDTCYESGTGVDEADVEYAVRTLGLE